MFISYFDNVYLNLMNFQSVRHHLLAQKYINPRRHPRRGGMVLSRVGCLLATYSQGIFTTSDVSVKANFDKTIFFAH